MTSTKPPFLTNRAYDTLVWIAQILLPAVATFVLAVGNLVNWEYATVTAGIIMAADVLLGTLLGVSSKQYKAAGLADPETVGTIVVNETDEMKQYRLNLDVDPETLDSRTKVAFNVRPPS